MLSVKSIIWAALAGKTERLLFVSQLKSPDNDMPRVPECQGTSS